MLTVFEELAREYEAPGLEERCPVKMVQHLRRDERGTRERLVVMPGRLEDGTVGCKTLHVDDDSGRVRASTTLMLPDGRTYVVDAAELTLVRCGLMAAYALRRASLLREGVRVGLMGGGRVNQAVAAVLRSLVGPMNLVLRGSVRDRGANWQRFVEMGHDVTVDWSEKPWLLRLCDVVVTCTTNDRLETALERSELPDPPLLVALDTGWLLGQSFRNELNQYADHPEQLRAHWRDEFPWDSCEPPMRLLAGAQLELPAVVYLHGIATADLVVARARLEGRI